MNHFSSAKTGCKLRALFALATLGGCTMEVGPTPEDHEDPASIGVVEEADLNTGPTCAKRSCDGKNPYTTRCASDAVPLLGTKTYEGANFFMLYYSPSCSAAWTEVDGPSSNNYHINVKSYYKSGRLRKQYPSPTSDYFRYTLMVSTDGLYTAACGGYCGDKIGPLCGDPRKNPSGC